MKTPSDGDEGSFGLGKPVRKTASGPVPDEYERFTGSHGDKLMRNKRTGAIETAPPRRIDPVPQPEVIYTTEQWDNLIWTLARSEWPREEFGSF